MDGERISTDDSDRVTNEIKRQHQQVWNTADSLDVKNGVILGFIIFIFIQVILSREIVAALSSNITFLVPPVATFQYAANLAALLTFLGGFISLVIAAAFGIGAISTRVYEDVDIHNKFLEYRQGDIDAATFDKSISMRLLENLKGNEEKTRAKANGYANTITWFLCGLILLVLHFIVMIAITSVFS
jgi:hypothetical protein